MGKQARQRSWGRLFVTSLLAGIGLATLRTLLRSSAPARPATPAATPPTPSVPPAPPAVPAASPAAETEPVTAAPDAQAAVGPAIALTKKSSVSTKKSSRSPADDQTVRAPEPVVEPVPAAVASGPEPAFVYEPPAPAPSAPASFWDTQPGPEWLPGFGAGQTAAGDPWTSNESTAAPVGTPDLGASGAGRLTLALKRWANETPRSQIIYSVLGVLCLIGAIVATVVILAL